MALALLVAASFVGGYIFGFKRGRMSVIKILNVPAGSEISGVSFRPRKVKNEH